MQTEHIKVLQQKAKIEVPPYTVTIADNRTRRGTTLYHFDTEQETVKYVKKHIDRVCWVRVHKKGYTPKEFLTKFCCPPDNA